MYPKSFFDNPQRVRGGTCFVLMPFASKFNEVHDAIVDAVTDPRVGFSCKRADEIFGGGHIIQDILRLIGESEVVVADLTDRNPNVFYELGIAHMVKEIEKVLVMTQDIEDVPFDLRHFRCIVYDQSDQGLRKLKDDLRTAIREVASTSYRFSVDHSGSHVFDQMLSARDNCYYTFEITKIWIGNRSAKFGLKVYRHIIGRAPDLVEHDSHFLNEGNSMSIPVNDVPWRIELEKAIPHTKAFMRVLPE